MKIYERKLFPVLKNALSDDRIIVLTGMRRVGKTTTARWLLEQVNSPNKVFFDLERLDLRAVFQESNYELVVDYLKRLGLDPSIQMTIALDEIQYIPNLPSVIKYLFDHYPMKFILTGSSSFYLKNLFTESMAGRKIVFEMAPLDFGEFLGFNAVPHIPRTSLEEMGFNPHEYERLKNAYDEYLTYGGLPIVVLESNPEKKTEILNDILSSYINIDVKAMADFRKISALTILLKTLALRIGNKMDYSKLSQIVGVSRPTLTEFLEFLEKTYVIHQLPAFTGADKAAVLGKKLYFLDNGFATILGNPGAGALFENAVFNQIRTLGAIAYLQNKSEFEIDFILTPRNGEPVALEAKYHPVESDLKRLLRVSERNGIKHSWLVGRQPSPGFTDFIWGGSIY